MSRDEITKRRAAKIKAGGYKEEKAYRKTFKGFLVSTWHNMRSRVNGTQKTKYHLYHGLPLCTKEEFYDFSFKDPEYLDLYVQWLISGCEVGLTPSIDRIVPSKGYVLSNIRWLTVKENSRLGAM